MKTSAIILITLLVAGSVYGDDLLDSAASDYRSKRSHAYHEDEILVAKVDFNGDGNAVVLLTYSVTDYFKHVGHTWTVMQRKDGKWAKPRALNRKGEVEDAAEVTFDEKTAGVVTLEKYGHRGILSYTGGKWRFIYLQDNTLKTVQFENAADTGMSDDDLQKLVNANKLVVQKRAIKNNVQANQ